MCPRKQVKREENFCQFIQKMGEKNKNKTTRCCKVFYVKMQAQKSAKIFENIRFQ